METFAVIGLGRFGRRLATLLAEAGAEVLAIDRNRELVDGIRDSVALAVCLDCTDEQALRAQGVDKVDVAIVGIGADFENSALTTATLKQLGVTRVISRATSGIRAEILSRIGADDIVNPEKEAAERWCNRLVTPAVMGRIELAEGYTLAQVAAPESFTNKTLMQLAVREKHQVNIVAIRRAAEEKDDEGRKKVRQFLISVPMGETVVKRGDVLVLIGSEQAVEAFPTA